jgi:hypothetical protein
MFDSMKGGEVRISSRFGGSGLGSGDRTVARGY